MLKCVSECKREVASLEVSLGILLEIILMVAQIFSTSGPTELHGLVIFEGRSVVELLFDPLLPFLRIDEDLHSLIVEAF
jgi:hypothetical protein